MDRLDSIYALHKLLKRRKTVVPRPELEQALELTRSTMTRLISYCRTNLGMPIEFDKERGGYHYDETQRDHYELPGLWFNGSELNALLTSHQLLTNVQPGILDAHIAPLRHRIERLLEHRHAGSKEIFKRVRILPMASRAPRLEDFQQCTDALVNRKQLRIAYSSRGKGELSERKVSPQRLAYYRDNWYLDAWCHLRKALRTFSLDQLRVLDIGASAKDISDTQLDAHVTRTYGIFAGVATNRAVIHFSADAARWVADEQWHPEQEVQHLGDGRLALIVPYGNPTELIRDILKYGPEAEIIAPLDLREQIQELLSRTLRHYRNMREV